MHKTTLPRTAHDTQVPQPPSDTAHCTAATLYLMSHYVQRPCPLVAHAIADQLKHLTQHCASGSSHLLQALAATLLPHWQPIAGGNTGAARH